ncbi:MAG: GNAT family N-acetyltransferase, partial [Clostridia bacterium]|nr:GNAT family N-acetyltransferase [Clostridia bacterium]
MFIKGKKVLLRAIELEDADVLQQMINDEEIEQMMWGYSFPVAYHQQIKWIENLSNEKSVFRAMIDVDDTAIGTIILSNIDMRNGSAEIHIKLA